MNLSEHIILIGAYGWQSPQWDGEFYPDDLPIEWKIGYYGNEFQIVVVPNEYWSSSPDQFQEWLDESDDALRFICEWPATGAINGDYEQAKQGITLLGERVAAVLVPITQMPTEPEWQFINGIAQDQLISFHINSEVRADFLATLDTRLPELDFGICWNGDQASQDDVKCGQMGICLLTKDREPKDLRRLLETMIATSDSDRSLALIVGGAPPDMKLLTNAGIILDLL